MCLMCEEDAFFRAYWEQVRSIAPRDGQPAAAAAAADPSRFAAIAVADEANAAPLEADAAGAPDAPAGAKPEPADEA